MKNDENSKLSLEWNVSREISKINYRIHTEAIKEILVPDLPKKYKQFVYANEADVLNVAMFGKIAKEWREKNPDKVGNIRDYATLHQLIVLSNLESFNSDFIHRGIKRDDRLVELNKIAKRQMQTLQMSKLIELSMPDNK